MGGFYVAYLESLCRRRGWRDPLYEISRSSSGYTCLVLVNGREFETDNHYESDGLAQENAAMRAFMVCKNFSVNRGMLAHIGVVQILPASERSGRHRRRQPNSGSLLQPPPSSEPSSGDSASSLALPCTDISMLSLSSVSSSSSTTSTGSHSRKVSTYSDTSRSWTSMTTNTPPSVEDTSALNGFSLIKPDAASQNLNTDQSAPVKLEKEEVLESLKYPPATEISRQSRKPVDIGEAQPEEVYLTQDEACEFDIEPRDFRGDVKTDIWASTAPSSVIPQMGQIVVEQTIFQYFIQTTADEGFWEEEIESEQFLQAPKLEGKDDGPRNDFHPDNRSHDTANGNFETEKCLNDWKAPILVSEQDLIGNTSRDGLDVGNDSRCCSDRSSSNTDADTDLSESEDNSSQASVYQRICGAEGRSSEDRKDFGPPILDPIMRQLVDRVMEEFWEIFGDSVSKYPERPWGNSSMVDGDQVTTDGNNTTETTSSSSSSSTNDQNPRTGQHKRGRDARDEDDHNNERKQIPFKQLALPAAGLKAVRFACPFRKHDPRIYTIYSHRSCALSGWTTIARIKEHMYRSHRKNPHCQRCWHVFDKQDQLDLHMTVSAAKICEVKSGQPPEGITAEHERRLRCRKKSHPKQSDEETWKDMYKILFPNEEVPSPYFEPLLEGGTLSSDADELADYEDYIQRELPSLVRRNIEETVRRETQPLEASLIATLVDVIRDSQETLSRTYRQRSETGGHSQTLGRESAIPSENAVPNGFESVPTVNDQLDLGFMNARVEAPSLEKCDGLDMAATESCLLERSTDKLSNDSGYGGSLKSCSRRRVCSCQPVQEAVQEISINGTVPAESNTEQNNEFLDFISFSNSGFLDSAECDYDFSGMNGNEDTMSYYQ